MDEFTPQASSPKPLLARLDAWMSASPWHPRLVPFVVYIVALPLIGFASDLTLYAYPVGYTIQCSLVAWLLWRYRKLTPELTLKFHWLAIPTGVGLLFAWVWLGYLANWLTGGATGALPSNPGSAELTMMEQMRSTPWLFWTSMVLRLVGMSLVVPLFEELFTRSLVLRAFHRVKPSVTGFVQFAHDLPLVGDYIMHTRTGQRAAAKKPMFTEQLQTTRVGDLTWFAVFFSTLVFMVNHMPRDYLGCIACGVVWCLVLGWTNRKSKPALGLGPIVWSHGLTNAALWAWTLYTNDWQFL